MEEQDVKKVNENRFVEDSEKGSNHDGSLPVMMDIDAQRERIDELAKQHGISETKLMAKVDWHIVPAICMLYLLAFLDRVNIANANVYGMSADLGLVGNQFNVALTIFFVPYVVFEVPSNYLMKRLKPHVWLSLCMVLFGCVSIGQGFVTNYGQLLATRFLLGLFEAGMFPGCFYLLSMWYRREEAQKRYTFFFASTSLAGAFGGLIAYGCNHISGKHGIMGWQWIFIIEGAITATIALLLFFCISDFLEEAKWLNENERAFLRAKLELDVGESNHHIPLTLRTIGAVFKDYKVFLAGVMYFCLIVPAYGYAFFAPSIIATFKYSPIQTQLHSIPPWAACFVFSLGLAFIADRIRHRYLLVVFGCLVSAVGFIILLAVHDNNHARYASTFLIAMGSYGAMPLIVCWTSQNFAGHHRRAVAIGFQIGFGNIGGIVATFVFLTKDAPRYTKGLSVCLAFVLFCIVVTSGYAFGIYRENRKKARGDYDERWARLTPQEQVIAGDLRPQYRYAF